MIGEAIVKMGRLQQADRLTEHFTLRELLHSQTASRRGLDNEPGGEALIQLQRLARLLEEVRAVVGSAVIVSSGYRSPAVNRAVGGARRSVHMTGRAADITAPRFGTAYELARELIAAGVGFDRLIFEGGWVHIEVAPEGARPRQIVMTAEFRRFRATRYHGGLVAPWELTNKA